MSISNPTNAGGALPRHARPAGPNYKWTALSNTTLGVLLGSLNSSIVLISLPAIFKGLAINPLTPAESGNLLWMLMGYTVTTATLLVTIGRLSDMFGRVRIYNLGFLIFTLSSILLFLTPVFIPQLGDTAIFAMIVIRILQGIGGGCLIANSAAILTDAFSAHQRGMALGINMVAAIAGSLGGLLLGGVLSAISWQAVFLVSVPFGILGTVWGYFSLREQSAKRRTGGIDVLGNLCLGGGLVLVLVAITYGLMPYGSSNVGWGNPFVIGGLIAGILLLIGFVIVESRVKNPLFNLGLFRIRAFSAGCAALFFSAMAYGGLQFLLIIWLQGVWLPLHGYSFEDTPLWSAIYMLPLLIGFMIFGVSGGLLSNRISARTLTTIGMLGLALGFILLTFLPANFVYLPFAVILFVIGSSYGVFSSPNTAAIMNALPRENRGVGSGMRATFQNAGSPLSLGLFFTIMVLVLSASLPSAIQAGLTNGGVPVAAAAGAAHIPPTGALFAAFLGYNPMQTLLPPAVLSQLAPTARDTLLGNSFFPNLISAPFMDSLRAVFYFSAFLTLLAALASALRGKRFLFEESDARDEAAVSHDQPLSAQAAK